MGDIPSKLLVRHKLPAWRRVSVLKINDMVHGYTKRFARWEFYRNSERKVYSTGKKINEK